MKPEGKIFECECGGEYLQVHHDVDGLYMFFISWPRSFWQRLKLLFKKDHHIRDVVLTKDDVKNLIKYLKEE